MKYLLLICLFATTQLAAQNAYTINAAGKKITFENIGALTVEGTSNSKLSIEREEAYEEDERAKGLRKISASGAMDNTGLGVSVTETADGIRIEQIGNKGNRIIVKVPNSARVVVNCVGVNTEDTYVRNFAGDLDITNEYNSVELKNISGPTAVSTIYGSITAIFDKTPSGDLQLISSYSSVDISLPASTKANIQLVTTYGSMYTDFDLNVEANGTTKQDDEKDHEHCCGNTSGLNAKINGGGTNIRLVSTYDDIYLRKQ